MGLPSSSGHLGFVPTCLAASTKLDQTAGWKPCPQANRQDLAGVSLGIHLAKGAKKLHIASHSFTGKASAQIHKGLNEITLFLL